MESAVVEGLVVGMGGDAGSVEGDKDVPSFVVLARGSEALREEICDE